MNYGFLQDINGDKCSKLLMGIAYLGLAAIMCVVAFIYGLDKEIKSASIIEFILGLLSGSGLGLFGITVFQKPRDMGSRND